MFVSNCKVSINRAGEAKIGEFSGVSAVSWCVLLLLEGILEFPGLGVAGLIPGLFLGTGDVLHVRTAKKALCLKRRLLFFQFISDDIVAIIHFCCSHIIVSLARRSKWFASY
jgi:hypothetical protein